MVSHTHPRQAIARGAGKRSRGVVVGNLKWRACCNAAYVLRGRRPAPLPSPLAFILFVNSRRTRVDNACLFTAAPRFGAVRLRRASRRIQRDGWEGWAQVWPRDLDQYSRGQHRQLLLLCHGTQWKNRSTFVCLFVLTFVLQHRTIQWRSRPSMTRVTPPIKAFSLASCQRNPRTSPHARHTRSESWVTSPSGSIVLKVTTARRAWCTQSTREFKLPDSLSRHFAWKLTGSACKCHKWRQDPRCLQSEGVVG